jgi:hypothetical protein
VRNVLQDAAWQIFQPESKAAGIPSILDQLDHVISDILN